MKLLNSPQSLLFITSTLLSTTFATETDSNSYLGVYTVVEDTNDDKPLASKLFPWPYFPNKADSSDGGGASGRGPQIGYNNCNASTGGQDSLCQTAYINNISDFCLWGATQPNSVVGDVEGEMVAYCIQPKWGTRVIPDGTITGIQFIRTPHYVEIVGFFDQTKLNVAASDPGGEEDDHGQDDRGNPIGALVYSNAFQSTNPNTTFQQITEWSFFIGSNVFCAKACDPAYSGGARLCDHVYDEVGCDYNDPANYAAINGTFQSCLGDDQLPPGDYVVNGQTLTWYQTPPYNPPYTAAIPATSSCTTYSSAQVLSVFGATTTTTTTTTTKSLTTVKTTSTSRAVSTSSIPTPTGSSSSSGGGTSGGIQTVSMGSSATFFAVGMSLIAVFGGALL